MPAWRAISGARLEPNHLAGPDVEDDYGDCGTTPFHDAAGPPHRVRSRRAEAVPQCAAQAGDESSPASSSTKRKSRTAASRPSSSAMQQSRGGTGSGAAPRPAPSAGRAARYRPYGERPAESRRQPESHSSTTTASGPAERYFLMKQVKIIDQGMGQGKPAYDLMIPTTWQFKGWVNYRRCRGRVFRRYGSPSSETQKAPTTPLSYRCFPSTRGSTSMIPPRSARCSMQNQRDAQFGMKPCPVRAPIQAAEFLRQDLIAKYRKGKTVVSIDPFPELDQIVRYRLGLPPTAAGGSASGIRTDAARARLAYDDDKGQPVEEWITAAIVVRSDPDRRPRGSLRLARHHGHVLPGAQRQARFERPALQADREHHSPRAGMAEDGATGLLPLCIKRSSRSWRSRRR